jgi:transcriptional regulator GlxA family with amidase domain
MSTTRARGQSSGQGPERASGLLRVGILAYPGVQLAAVYGLRDLFATARHLPSAGGVRLDVQVLEASRWRAPAVVGQPLAALILPPSLEAVPHDDSSLLAPWLLQRHREGAVLCAVCAGAFLLASTGLLAGRPATTHWRLRAAFAASFPDVEVDTQKLVIDDGDVITAGGMMAWVDLGLALLRRFLGPTAMLAVARHWLVDPGGREQRFYDSFAPVLDHGDQPVLEAQHWLQAHHTHRVGLAALARRVGLSERTLLRRFRAATGHSPSEYLQVLRVERARESLERTRKSFDEIAWALGYHDAGSFRRIFAGVMGLSPGEYRRRFSVLSRRRSRSPG